ncbi:uncharacterized protein [Malus domestica]|uniref:uncharacterized protein n=1 Tax=Malus domestica TaxID=3750 RepID=UPI0007EC6FAA|nr:uncharacterized protein LOC108174055 [Malus domestica]
MKVASVWIPSSKAFSGREEWIQQEIKRITSLWITHWRLYFDGSCTQNAARAAIVIIDPKDTHHCYSFLLDYQQTTNNQVEFKALIILEILIELGPTKVVVFGDSELVINQLNGEYKCRHITIAGYYLAATQLLSY